jgi:GcrA cell cycle regulator
MSVHSPSVAWTEDRVGVLLNLWREGKSASDIAGYLHVTRNAAIGKLHRLGELGERKAAARRWNGRVIIRTPPTPPRRFSWEQHA